MNPPNHHHIGDQENSNLHTKLPKMPSAATSAALLGLTAFLVLAAAGNAAILPFLEPRPPSLLDDLWPTLLPDPFRVLEEIPVSRPDAAAWASTARVDWKETPEGHVITVDVPGMKRDELKIEVEKDRVLRISGERKRETEEKDDHWHRVERSSGKFWRSFKLPENVDVDSLGARLEDGVLTVKMKKLAPERIKAPRVVGIEGGYSTPQIDKEKKSEL